VLISEALSLIGTIESRSVEELRSDLSSIREAVSKSLRTIEKLANDLEREKIKVEEARFESIVEISKRTVVSSLRRESSIELPSPVSYAEAMKFKQRLEAITNRFREVSASHNRVFNVFIKKYAGKLKGEFETLSTLSKEVNSILAEFENMIIGRLRPGAGNAHEAARLILMPQRFNDGWFVPFGTVDAADASQRSPSSGWTIIVGSFFFSSHPGSP